jgi:hypothetical protein
MLIQSYEVMYLDKGYIQHGSKVRISSRLIESF